VPLDGLDRDEPGCGDLTVRHTGERVLGDPALGRRQLIRVAALTAPAARRGEFRGRAFGDRDRPGNAGKPVRLVQMLPRLQTAARASATARSTSPVQSSGQARA
jgi:hypothetical protein